MTIHNLNSKFVVCGHRGFAAEYPENTMSSFRAAAELGVDMIEMDVVCSKEGIPVICHDYELERTSDGVGLLADYTLEELRGYNMAAKFAKRPMVERIVTFEEMCALLDEFPELMFNIDMKTDDGTIANRVADIVESKGYKGRVIFNGLNGYGLAQMHDRGFMVEASPDGFYGMQNFGCLLGDGVKKAEALCYNACQDVNPENVEKLKNNYGVEVWAWCSSWDGYSRCSDGSMKKTDCCECLQNMLDNGVTMALCNHPDRVIEYLKEKGLR